MFLLGEYNRRLARQEQAKKYFEQMKVQKYKDEDGSEKEGHPYFLELVKDREELMKRQ